MKREGRQHGMVRTYRILPPPLNPRPGLTPVNSLTSPPTAGLFTKVPSKPTNHSKFTGKCGQARCLDCHLHPTTKAKVKTKGETKLRSYDFASTYKLLTWRVAGGRSGSKFSGVSATGILDLMSEDKYGEDYDNDNDYDCEEAEEETKINGDGGENDYDNEDDGAHDDGDGDGDNDNEQMRDYDVGVVIGHVEDTEEEDEGWCLVEEMMIVDL
ncbi:PREDICTED: uncharacterized protein LOC104805351 [Tarenaya hassleriana]|uniref:uncharacterized protein LOC104805351 n=1 Tax=Tarenaya hassleriana TaxID=28532 RepID=UPI00053C9443|nr:PREDICTED: uncharacterized protein LOC104805351 [Tarenaya hassleriana]